MSEPPQASVTQTETFRLRVQRSEQARTVLMIGVFAFLLLVPLVRRAGGDEVMRIEVLFWSTVIMVSAALGCEIAALRAFRRANRDGRLLNDKVWKALTILELAAPLIAVTLLAEFAPHGPIAALTAPVILLLPLVVMMSLLHLRPRVTLLTGLAAAAAHLALVIRAIAIERPLADAIPQLLTYPVFIALCGVAGAMAARHIKRYVQEAADESAAREHADHQLKQFRHELSLARDIQQGLLPTGAPRLPGFDIAGMNRPADLTGGDYYDWQPLPDGRLAVVMADVAGHGLGPAMVMAVCRAYARASTPLVPGSGQLLQRLNTLVHDDVQGRRFITLAIALLESDCDRVELSSAGHGPTLHYRAADGSVEHHGGDGIPLGLYREEQYDEARSLQLRSGDVLLLLTDGFFEWARPGDDQQFGIGRLEAALRENAARPAQEIIEAIDAAVRAFTTGSSQPDDMTAVAIKRL